jgi:hypothetical protein
MTSRSKLKITVRQEQLLLHLATLNASFTNDTITTEYRTVQGCSMVIFAEKRGFQPVLWDRKYQHWFSFHTVWSDTSFVFRSMVSI